MSFKINKNSYFKENKEKHIKEDSKMNVNQPIKNPNSIFNNNAVVLGKVNNPSKNFAAVVNEEHTPAQFNKYIEDLTSLANKNLSITSKKEKCSAIATRYSNDQKEASKIAAQLFNLFIKDSGSN